MKYFWDFKYIKIAFYVVLTFICVYISFLTIGLLPGFVEKLFLLLFKTVSFLAPLWIALIIAYLLDPVVSWFHERLKRDGKKTEKLEKRTAAVFLTYGIFFGGLVLLLLLLYKNIEKTDMNGAVFQLQYSLDGFVQFLKGIHEKLLGFQFWRENHKAVIDDGMNLLIPWVESIGEKVMNSLPQASGKIFQGVISFVIAFYLLKDKTYFLFYSRNFFQRVLKGKYQKAERFYHAIHSLLSGYVRGQLLDSLTVGVLVALALTVLRVRFSLGVGVFSAFGNLIPYVGSFTTFTLAVLIALFTDGFMKGVIVALCIIVIQQIDSNIIGPRIVGKSVKLHPVVIILALSAAGRQFGLLGLVLAVPVVAVVKLIFTQYFQRNMPEKKDPL